MLNFENVSYSYPYSNQNAVTDLSFSLRAGELLLCTGRSGCGKSTLIRLANGLCPHYMHGTLSGRVMVTGKDTALSNPQEISQSLGTLFQDPERQFFAMTVRDELGLALQWRGDKPEQIASVVAQNAERLGITEILGQTLFGLSEGQKQKVALASLLCLRPRLLVLDEPSANLDPESTAELANTLNTLKAEGIAILVVDHRLAWLRPCTDKVLVLDGGSVAASGNFEILDDPALQMRHGLRSPVFDDPRANLPLLESSPADGVALLSCRGIQFKYAKRGREIFNDASFAFQAGEVIALTGENGVGKTTLSRILTGLSKPQKGEVMIAGKVVKPRQLPRHAQVVLQNASHQLRMNSVLLELCDAANPGRGLKDVDKALNALQSYGLAELKDRHPQSLSGGEKQRLALACATIRQPQVLLLDEPTSGLDGENMKRIAQNVQEVADNGAVVLSITHDLELMRLICRKQLCLKPLNAA